ncbi:hypothetical protein Fmac_018780 [Flemingia macrophylla]|uniref:Uncharacterized protein n=1 Tax=Flemingia macrophylla TaxID=520843 RepID=A0ABD1M5Y4_9FABA
MLVPPLLNLCSSFVHDLTKNFEAHQEKDHQYHLTLQLSIQHNQTLLLMSAKFFQQWLCHSFSHHEIAYC